MAERDYMRGEGVTPIQDMTTRQLRKYIRERTEEAQARLDSIEKDKRLDLEDMSLAFRDQLKHVQSFGTGRSGGLKKDTSRMTKEEMAEYAYAIRDLNMLDTESKYARDIDYKENRDRYEKFIKNRTSEENRNKADREYWQQYLTEKKNVSKRGYEEYKNFVNFLRNIDEVMTSYGYETIKDKYYDETDPEMQQIVADLLLEVYRDNAGSGMTMGDLVDEFNRRLNDKKKELGKVRETTAAPRSGKKPTAKKSKNNIKAKSTGKMKNGSVREKQTTSKL